MAEVAVRGARRLDRVESLAHGAVADRVEVHLEAVGVELRHRLLEELRLDHRDAAHVLLARQPVRLEHDGGVVLHHAVLHDLDGADVEPALRVFAAQALDVLDLFEALAPLPPDRADDVQLEVARVVDAAVGLEVLLVDRGVLDAGDAVAIQHLDRVAEPRVALRVRRRRLLGVDQRVAALLEAADGLVRLRVAIDAAVGRVGRVVRDARDLDRLAVRPGRMAVAAVDEHRAVRHDGVEELLARECAGAECRHRPAAARDPRVVGVRLGALLDLRDVLLGGVQRVEVAGVRLHPARDRVDVHVLHARDDHAALQRDDLRLRADVVLGAGVRADVDDAPVVDRDRLGPGTRAVLRVDRAARQREVRDRRFLLVELLGRLLRAARQGCRPERGCAEEEADRRTEAEVQVLRHW